MSQINDSLIAIKKIWIEYCEVCGKDLLPLSYTEIAWEDYGQWRSLKD